MHTHKIFTFALLLLATYFLLPNTAHAQTELSGVWTCNDGGLYYIRHYEDGQVWWYGEEDAQNPSWSNVAYGKLQGNTLILSWSDVPKGFIDNHGKLEIEITPEGKLSLITEEGGFGGSFWEFSAVLGEE